MRLNKKSKEIDLIVEPSHLTKEEAKEISEWIDNYKLKRKKAKKKHSRHKAAA